MHRFVMLIPLALMACSEKEERGFGIVSYDSGEADADTDTDTDTDIDDSEFDEVYAAALAGCLGCHGGTSPAGGLNLIADAAYDSLVDGTLYVIPGDPDGSLLVQKMRGDPGIDGDPMPPSDGATDAQIEVVVDWISAGANP
jgi:hypothetical protein